MSWKQAKQKKIKVICFQMYQTMVWDLPATLQPNSHDIVSRNLRMSWNCSDLSRNRNTKICLNKNKIRDRNVCKTYRIFHILSWSKSDSQRLGCTSCFAVHDQHSAASNRTFRRLKVVTSIEVFSESKPLILLKRWHTLWHWLKVKNLKQTGVKSSRIRFTCLHCRCIRSS